MTTQELFDIFKEAISENKPHQDYGRTVELAKDYHAIMTGDGQEKMVLSYRSRETPDQKNQRVDITISRTEAEANRFVTLTDKIKRVDNVVDNVYYENDAADKSKIAGIQAEFYQGLSLSEYLHQFVQFNSYYDPNAWLMINFKKVDGINVPYPVEFPSSEVYRWSETINTVDWFIARQKVIAADATNTLDKFTMLAPDISIVAKQMEEGETAKPEFTFTVEDGRKFVFTVSETKSKVTPVFKAGYIRDVKTGRRTFVSILQPAMKIFKRLINDGSEYDLSMALHGFFQKIQMGNDCLYEENDGEEIVRCNEGYLGYEGSKRKCPSCDGVGLKIHISPQDVIIVRKPDGKEEHIPLTEMVHYVKIPVEIIEQQRENIDRCIEDLQITILNTQLVDKSEIQQNVTATEKVIDLDNINAVLYKHGSNFSRLYKQTLKQCAIYMGVDKGLYVNHEYPKDFQLETLDQLIAMRKNALDAGLPYPAIENIDTKILVKQSQGDHDNVLWVRTWEMFRPWKEIGVTERLNLLVEVPVTDKKRVLYTYFEEVKRNIESKKTDGGQPLNFYKIKDIAIQQKLIDKAVDEIIVKYDVKAEAVDDRAI